MYSILVQYNSESKKTEACEKQKRSKYKYLHEMTNAGPRARARAPRLRKMPSSAPRSDSMLRPDTIAVRHGTTDADAAPDERECE